MAGKAKSDHTERKAGCREKGIKSDSSQHDPTSPGNNGGPDRAVVKTHFGSAGIIIVANNTRKYINP